MVALRVLALEPYFGGSHRSFLEGWQRASRHEWSVMGLPAHKWKWRMRHGALTLSRQVAGLVDSRQRWDVVFCSDMLDLAAFCGLMPRVLAPLPRVVYFHENQLTYPVRYENERDYHFGYTNMTTALAADEVWFNSAFNRDSFLAALPRFLRRMPDYQHAEAAEQIRARSRVMPPGVEPIDPPAARKPGPLHILWAARWEHDKSPERFFEALRRLRDAGTRFRLSVIGEQFRDVPPVFEQARRELAERIGRWGYQPTREEYVAALREADVVVSTAAHEFFGLSVVEAMLAGATPLLPRRLAYPELLADLPGPIADELFYDGSTAALVRRLARWSEEVADADNWRRRWQHARACVERFIWPQVAPRLDKALEDVVSRVTACGGQD